MSKKPEISVVISTYNAVEWLKKALAGYKVQCFTNFEVVIADDGSTEETKQTIENIKENFPVPVLHVWQEDEGFQKTKILNKAIVATNADYILMTDGDCIPRKDFVEVHYKARKEGYFISGGYFKLPMHISENIREEDIFRQKCFELEWLKEQGLKSSYKTNKISAKGKKASFLNWMTPTNPSWNGHNSSGWKKDILAVNGFDERMQYGGEDRELGERLMNYGIKPIQKRYSAVCVHLDHSRGYINQDAIDKNLLIREETKKNKKIRTPFGITKSDHEG